MPRVFISYRHSDGEWVWNRLTPCLEAGGAEVLIDRERFQAGIAVVGQMDAAQDRADVHVLVITKEYLERGCNLLWSPWRGMPKAVRVFAAMPALP